MGEWRYGRGLGKVASVLRPLRGRVAIRHLRDEYAGCSQALEAQIFGQNFQQVFDVAVQFYRRVDPCLTSRHAIFGLNTPIPADRCI